MWLCVQQAKKAAPQPTADPAYDSPDETGRQPTPPPTPGTPKRVNISPDAFFAATSPAKKPRSARKKRPNPAAMMDPASDVDSDPVLDDVVMGDVSDTDDEEGGVSVFKCVVVDAMLLAWWQVAQGAVVTPCVVCGLVACLQIQVLRRGRGLGTRAARATQAESQVQSCGQESLLDAFTS